MSITQVSEAASIGDHLLRQYVPPAGVYDEMLAQPGQLRSHWQGMVRSLTRVQLHELSRRGELADRLIHENGVTYNVYGQPNDKPRPWELDILPVVYSAGEWHSLSEGLRQRVTLLNLILADIFGPQRLLKEGHLPPAAVFGHPRYLLPFHNLAPAGGKHIHLYAAELARSPDGRWWIMADRTEVPSGAGYAVENRIVASRTWPHLIQECRVQRLASFFMKIQEQLQRLARHHKENPRIVLLTPGPSHPYYFEDAFLSRYLGYTLVEGGDLAVRNDQVALKTLGGLLPVDVIFRRIPDAECDPLELGGTSPHGIPGLLQATRAGHVSVVNSLGCSIVETPLFMACLPALCQLLLREPLKMPSIASWWCQDPVSLNYVLDHLDDLVIKPAFQHSGREETIVDQLSAPAKEKLIAKIKAEPEQYVAQEKIARSSTPSFHAGSLQTGHIALRTYAVATEDSYQVMPGGLIRVASSTQPLELSISAGEYSKDAWVLSEGPVKPVSLLAPTEQVIRLSRSGTELPSRVADHLFWLGRNLERADSAARLMRALLDRLAVETKLDSVTEVPSLLRVMAGRGLIAPDFVVESLKDSLPDVEDALISAVFGEEELLGLRATLRELHRQASVVRDRISIDTWRIINRLATEFLKSVLPEETDFGDALESLDRLLFHLAACNGLVSDAMTRGQAWRFLDFGRKVERALQMVTLLRYTLLSLAEPFGPVLQAVLDIADSAMTYRSRYLARLQPAPVLDLLLTDETNPRAIAFQLVALADHVNHLPREDALPTRTGDQRTIMSALHNVQMADVEQLVKNPRNRRNALEKLLNHVEDRLNQLSDQVSRKYLIHAGAPRQMQDETPISISGLVRGR